METMWASSVLLRPSNTYVPILNAYKECGTYFLLLLAGIGMAATTATTTTTTQLFIIKKLLKLLVKY
jgi:hypothetical protein